MTAPWRLAALLVALHAAAIAARPREAGELPPPEPGTTTSRAAAPAAPPRLVDTGLYERGRVGVVADANRPFSPQYPLWTDGAAKSRWAYLPAGTAIDAADPARWEFPIGTKFWKEFRFEGRPVETRFIWRATADAWVLASYVWNETGTDATLVPEEGLPGVAAVSAGSTSRHSIPSAGDCRICHGDDPPQPLGFNALQLSDDRDPLAPHAEPLAADMWTVGALLAAGRLRAGAGIGIDPAVRIAGDPDTRAVVGYLSTNCGSCHRRGSAGVPLLGTSLGPADVLDGEATLAAMLAHVTRWQAPGATGGHTRLLDPADPEHSALLRRMQSRRPSSQMPPLGSAVADEDALRLVRRWLSTRSR